MTTNTLASAAPTVDTFDVAPTLDFAAAWQVSDTLTSLTADDQESISAWSLSLTDYLFWYRKAHEFAVATHTGGPLDEQVLFPFTGTETERGFRGAALAALVRPFIGRGVHRAQVQLLELSFTGVSA